MLLGYVRVSTVEQNEARQIEALQQRGVETENLYIDKQSGKNINRPKLKELLDYVRRGDTVVTESISRIARNTKDLLSIVEQLQGKGVEFVSLKESLDTTTPQGKFMLTIFAAMAEWRAEKITARKAMEIVGLKPNTFYRRVKEMGL